ncbi:MAG TPA: hypothetical protein VIG47_01225 [Gemmatimonadaceae bacterium]|jgi:hypothetical protein
MLQWVIFVGVVVSLTVWAVRVATRLADHYPLDPDEESDDLSRW